MSDLSDILNAAQIAKHYEAIQFLSSHANVEYSLSQLDFLIPRGASLQRFPEAWLEYMESGQCGNQCIEVCRRAADVQSGCTVEGKEEVFLICRRPELHGLDELARLLQSPAMMPDAEGCVALHTDQVVLPEMLLRESQQRGLLYYFPDDYVKSREHRLVKGKRSLSRGGDTLNVFLRDDEAEAVLGADGPSGQLNLPAGVVAQSMLYTRRGVPVRSKNAIPASLNVGERALVIVERTGANSHDISAQVKAPSLRVSLGQPTGSSGGIVPVDVRVKASGSGSGNPRSLMDIRGQAKGKITMSLYVDEKETIVPFEVLDENVSMPGVMIGRDSSPALPLPESIRINDPALWSSGLTEEEEIKGGRGKNMEDVEFKKTGAKFAGAALSWWLNPSPAVLRVRDLTTPDSETMNAASQIVWIPHQKDEVTLRAVRKTLQEQQAAELARRSRRKRNRNRELRNCHMLHYGFDASVPFSGQPQDG